MATKIEQMTAPVDGTPYGANGVAKGVSIADMIDLGLGPCD